MNGVVLFNPRAVKFNNYRIPNSILQIAASIEGKYDYAIVDGNREKDPWIKLDKYFSSGEYSCFGCTVMPGPQLNQAITLTKRISERYPNVKIVWGGYFASNQYKVVVGSPYVDFVINGPGDHAFPALLDALTNDTPHEFIQNLIYQNIDGEIIVNSKEGLGDQDKLPDLPYEKLNKFYSIEKYLRPTHLGNKTIAYHSSLGCPFTCSFCAVVPIYEARWKGKSAKKVYDDIKHLKDTYGADSIEFHDNNFFVSEKRVIEFCHLVMPDKMSWWGEGRIDTIDKYKDETLALMRDAGLKMIFLGAESGSNEILANIDKGGKQTGDQIRAFAERLKRFDIVPEYSFVLGFPSDSDEKVMRQIDEEIAFIREIKQINPLTEIIIYLYSPVPTEGSDLYRKIIEAGFSFPMKLEDWLEPVWENFDLRKNPLTPWLKPRMVDKVKNFETVINARYPNATSINLTEFQKSTIRWAAKLRYKFKFYHFPYELKLMQKLWLRYRQPEIEGF